MQPDCIFSDRQLNRRKRIKRSLNTVLLGPIFYTTHFCLISLSRDWSYRSTLTIPYVACRQTYILRPIIYPPKTHQTKTQYCATWSTLLHYALLPHLIISRLTISVKIDHTICSMQSDSYSPTDHLTAENTSNRYIIMCYSIHSTIFSHFYPISLSSDQPYRSTLTIPSVACSQTHILRAIILPPKTHRTVT